MPTITWITPDQYKEDRTAVFIDNKFCTSIRNRTFMAMNLKKGDTISCEELKEKENFHWKKTYGVPSWEKEQVRLGKVKMLVRNLCNNLDICETGFGAGKTEFLAMHPDESGSPDLTIYKHDLEVMYIEVTGTEHKRGDDYWIRPDKITYFQNHPEKNIWIILYYNDVDQFIFIRPDQHKTYSFSEELINGAIEYYVKFNDTSIEVKDQNEFEEALFEIC